jgi:hypothetical protein
VPNGLFEKVQKKIDKRGAKARRGSRDRKSREELRNNLLPAGSIFCARCGGKILVKGGMLKDDKFHGFYRCAKRNTYGSAFCESPNVVYWKVDDQVEEAILKILSDKKLKKMIAARLRELQKPRTTNEKNEISQLKKEQRQIEKKLLALKEIGEETDLSDAQLRVGKQLRKQADALMKEIAEMEEALLRKKAPAADIGKMDELFKIDRAVFRRMDARDKREIAAIIFKRVLIDGAEIKGIEYHEPFDVIAGGKK